MFCKNCGVEIDGMFKFCTNCGQKLDNILIISDEPVSRPGSNKIRTVGSTPIHQDDYYKITELLNKGKKIAAVKLVREITGFGLADAKEFLDTIEREYE